MPVDHTVTSRTATVATMLLVLVQLLHLISGDHAPYVSVLLIVLVGATTAAWMELRRGNSVEARLAAGFLAVLSGGGMLLSMTVGLPGQTARPPTLATGATLALSVVVLVLLVADHSGRSPGRRRSVQAVQPWNKSPYAS
jgi:type IV secretory pathway VirB2 component (pilin)